MARNAAALSKGERQGLSKGELWKQIRREDRKKARAKMAGLKAGTRGAREARRETRAKTIAECRDARAVAKSRARATCDAGAEQYLGARAAHAQARAELLDEQAERRQLRAIGRSAKGREKERTRRGPSVAERRAESDDEVRASIDADLIPLWEKIKRSIKGSARLSRTDEFLHYVHEHPDAGLEAQGDPYERAAHEMESRAAQANPRKRNPPIASSDIATTWGATNVDLWSRYDDQIGAEVLWARAVAGDARGLAHRIVEPGESRAAAVEQVIRAAVGGMRAGKPAMWRQLENPSKADRDLSAWEKEYERKKAAQDAWLDAHEGRSFSIWLRSMKDLGLVSLDPSKPGRWRHTRFVGDEPIGHSDHATWRDAAKNAIITYNGDLDRVKLGNHAMKRNQTMARKNPVNLIVARRFSTPAKAQRFREIVGADGVRTAPGAHPGDVEVLIENDFQLDVVDHMTAELGGARRPNPRQRHGKKAAVYVAEEMRARSLQPKGRRRSKKQAVAIGLARARRGGAAVRSPGATLRAAKRSPEATAWRRSTWSRRAETGKRHARAHGNRKSVV